MKIVVVGAGYVGLSNAILLAQKHEVTLVDIDEERVAMINQKRSPLADSEIEEYLAAKPLHLTAVKKVSDEYTNADYVIVATPTDYDPATNCFDTSSVESVIQKVMGMHTRATIVIKSTVPIGFLSGIYEKYACERLLFSPEFLREGKALYDCLHPSRIVVGMPNDKPGLREKAESFARLLRDACLSKDAPIMCMRSTEAEAIKLFANAYLAMRVAYFNELDTYASVKGLDTKAIIEGISYDPRIGNHYNNPSFGYGGYCFPKDTKQLAASFEGIPNALIRAIVESNRVRKQFVCDQVMEILQEKKQQDSVVGIFRLIMKSSSDNFRQSAIRDIMKQLQARGIAVMIYEPTITDADVFQGAQIENDLNVFKRQSDVILANRMPDELMDVSSKVYSRDVFGTN